MQLELAQNPREFQVGIDQAITLKDMGHIYLEPNEQITFITPEKQEYDICRKEWGYYATPSINGRLKRFGFKTALVKNFKGQGFVMLVETQKIDQFLNYLASEKNELVCWLDEDFSKVFEHHRQEEKLWCHICKSSGLELVKKFDAPPSGENDFKIERYARNLFKCQACGHLFNAHQYNFDELYSADYCDRVYQDRIKETFLKIISLPGEKSDNHHRVQRVQSLVESVFHTGNPEISVLDIGSGLCVFLYRLKQITGWDGTALDPDPRQAQHARDVCGIKAINETLFNYHPDRHFHLITLNKVLEHFKNPLEVLKKIKSYFTKDKPGYLYLEVPDGEMAVLDSADREEFFVEHYHAFSYQSLQIVLKESGWHILTQSRLKEPSEKYTLYSFAKSH